MYLWEHDACWNGSKKWNFLDKQFNEFLFYSIENNTNRNKPALWVFIQLKFRDEISSSAFAADFKFLNFQLTKTPAYGSNNDQL